MAVSVKMYECHSDDSHCLDIQHNVTQLNNAKSLSEIQLTKEHLNYASCLINGFKVNQFQSNHHVGQGKFQGYAHRCIKTLIGDEV